MKPIDGDYIPPENEYDVVPDKRYTIEEVGFNPKSLDSATGKPKLVDTKFGSMVYLILKSLDDEIDIPLSARLNELPYLVQSFTGKAGELLPPVPALSQVQDIEKYLLLVVNTCNTSLRRPSVLVKKGWASVYRFSNTAIPPGTYHFYMSDIVSKNDLGLPCPVLNERYGNYQYDVLFKIALNQYGKPFGWSGVQYLAKFLPYGAEVKETPDGLVPDWVRGPKTGEYTSIAKGFSKFVTTVAPLLFANKELRFADPSNILPEVLGSALESQQLLCTTLSVNDKGYNVFNYKDIVAVSLDNIKDDIPYQQDNLPQSNVDIHNHKVVLAKLLNILAKKDIFSCSVKGGIVFGDEYTSEQKAVLRDYLTPLKKKLSSGILENLTVEDVELIFDSVVGSELSDNQIEAISELYKDLEVAVESGFNNF